MVEDLGQYVVDERDKMLIDKIVGYRIIRSSDKQADIEDKVKLLNLNRLALSDDFRTRNKKLLHLVDIFQGNQDFSA